jgi:hypothetical protein
MVPRAETKSNTRAIARQERAVPGVDSDVSNGVLSWQPFCILERNKLDFRMGIQAQPTAVCDESRKITGESSKCCPPRWLTSY